MGNFFFKQAFPKPRASYSFGQNDVFTIGENSDRVVVRLLKCQTAEQCNRLIIFFHGNGEDTGETEYLMETTMNRLKAHLVAVEYPQYGPYSWADISEQRICQDADRVYDFIRHIVKLQENQIVVAGRSMGSGPATYLASKNKQCGGLVLISPFRSFRSVVNDLLLPSHTLSLFAAAGMAFAYYLFKEKKKFLVPTVSGFALLSPAWYLVSVLVPNVLNNERRIQAVEAPTLLIHGHRDDLITKDHSETLFQKCKATDRKLVIRPNMTHNRIDPEGDVAEPVESFFRDLRIPDLPEISYQQLAMFEKK